MKIVSDVYVHVYAGSVFDKFSMLVLAATDMTSLGYALIGKTQIGIEVDGKEVVVSQIKALDEQIEGVEGECARRVNDLEVARNNLLSLENGLNEKDES
jgi:hypothetical protein